MQALFIYLNDYSLRKELSQEEAVVNEIS